MNVNDGSFELHLNKNLENLSRTDQNNQSSNLDKTARKEKIFSKIQQLEKQAEFGQLTSKDFTSEYIKEFVNKKSEFPELRYKMLYTILNRMSSNLDIAIDNLLAILGDDQSINIEYLLQLVEQIETNIKVSGNTSQIKDFQAKLADLINHPNKEIQTKAREVLGGINVPSQGSEADGLNTTGELSLPAQPISASSQIDGVGASMHYPIDDGFEIKSATNNKMTIESKKGDMRVQVDPPTVVTDIRTESGVIMRGIGALGMDFIENNLLAIVVNIGGILPTLFVAKVVPEWAVQLEKQALAQESNQFRVAIVTDYVAALSELESVDWIRKVSTRDKTATAIKSEYETLISEEYHFIISLHLNRNLARSYDYAMIAKEEIEKQNISGVEIHVHHTFANGVGLGLILYELDQAIRNGYSPMEVNQLAQQLINNYKHWVCPLEFEFIKHHKWVNKIIDNQKKLKMRLFNFIPIIELDHLLTVTNVFYTQEAALSGLITILDREIQQSKRKITRICIEYKTVYREAINIRNRIKVRYPTIRVSLHSVGSYTTQLFGPELVGVCIL